MHYEPFFQRKFNRGKGPLGILEDIYILHQTMNAWPTRLEVQSYRTLKYDKTAYNSETFSDLLSSGALVLVNNKNYVLTERSMQLLRYYGVIQ